MEVEHERPKRKRFLWILIGLAVLIAAGGLWMTQEAPSPYEFINRYEVAEKRTSRDGKLRILVLKADAKDVWNSVRSEFSGRRVFSSTGMMNVNGKMTEYMSMGTENGLIKVSNDLSFADEGFGVELQNQDVRPGYCAVAFTRPKSLFDKAMEWMQKFFRGSKPAPTAPQQERIPFSEPTIRV